MGTVPCPGHAQPGGGRMTGRHEYSIHEQRAALKKGHLWLERGFWWRAHPSRCQTCPWL